MPNRLASTTGGAGKDVANQVAGPVTVGRLTVYKAQNRAGVQLLVLKATPAGRGDFGGLCSPI